jgi:serine/threonine protein kinase
MLTPIQCPKCASLPKPQTQLLNQQTQRCPACNYQDPSLLPQGSLLGQGRFRIEMPIDRGAFGITYRATDLTTQVVVVIKELLPESMAHRDASRHVQAAPGRDLDFANQKTKCLQEADVLKRLNHASIVRCIEAWQEWNTVYIAMDWIDGQNLDDIIRTKGKISNTAAKRYIVPLLSALEEIHQAGLLHRDIKPANIMIDKRTDAPILIDFGIACDFLDTKTRTSIILTLGYAPLEQFSSITRLTPATDLFALAATFYHAVSGRTPTEALARAQGAALLAIGQVAPTVDGGLAKAITAGLEMHLTQRPQTATQMKVLLTDPPIDVDDPPSNISQELIVGVNLANIYGGILNFCVNSGIFLTLITMIAPYLVYIGHLDYAMGKTLSTTSLFDLIGLIILCGLVWFIICVGLVSVMTWLGLDDSEDGLVIYVIFLIAPIICIIGGIAISHRVQPGFNFEAASSGLIANPTDLLVIALLLYGVASIVLVVITLVVWFLWILRSYKNLMANGKVTNYQLNWVFAFHFIPLLNLIYIPLVVGELIEKSNKRMSALIFMWALSAIGAPLAGFVNPAVVWQSSLRPLPILINMLCTISIVGIVNRGQKLWLK